MGRWECSKKCGALFESGGSKYACGGRRKFKGLLMHDFRRSAAKMLRRAGVPESVIMSLGGWKTASMFRRYAIVSAADQKDAMLMLEKARSRELSPRVQPPAATESEGEAAGTIQ